MREDIVSVKCVVIGDVEVGKTSAAHRWCKREYEELGPTSMSNELIDVLVTEENLSSLHPSLKIGQIVRLHLWDTGGFNSALPIISQHMSKPQAYPGTDVVLMAFDLSKKNSDFDLKYKFLPEKKHYIPKTPVVIGGMKLDIWREDISQSDIENLVKVTKASGYKLCSAYTGEGIDDLFNLIIKTGV